MKNDRKKYYLIVGITCISIMVIAVIVISNFIRIILSNIFLLFHIISLGYYLKMNIGVSCVLLGCIYTSYVNLKRI